MSLPSASALVFIVAIIPAATSDAQTMWYVDDDDDLRGPTSVHNKIRGRSDYFFRIELDEFDSGRLNPAIQMEARKESGS